MYIQKNYANLLQNLYLLVVCPLGPTQTILACPHCHIPLCCLATFSHRYSCSAVFSQPAWWTRPGQCHAGGEKERQKNGQESKRRHTTKKTWPATFDWALEKDSSESWGPRWLLPWYSPRRWLLAPKNGCAALLGHPVEINLSGAPSFLSLVLFSGPASSIHMLRFSLR